MALNLFGLQSQTAGQPQSGLARLLDPSVALPLAAGLLGNQGNAANFAAGFGYAAPGLAEQKKLQAQTAEQNKTRAFFEKNAPEYAQMLDAGMPMGDVWSTYTKQRFDNGGELPANVKSYQFAVGQGYKGTLEDWETKGIREQDPTFGREQDLRKEYGATPEYKRYDDVRASYERIRSSAQMDSGAGDIGTIFGFMKMLDPGSVVREGEFATAQNSSGVPDRVRNLYNQVVQGSKLTPDQRSEFVRVADSLYENERKRIEALNTRYGTIAGQYQLDPSRVVQQPMQYEPMALGGGGNPADPLGIRGR